GRADRQHHRFGRAHHPQPERNRRRDAGRAQPAPQPRQGDAGAAHAALREDARRSPRRRSRSAQGDGRQRRPFGAHPYLQLPARAGDRPPHRPDAAQARRSARRPRPDRVDRRAHSRRPGQAARRARRLRAVTIAQALREAAARLGETSDTARLDAELLMAHALGVSRSELLLRHMDAPAPAAFAALVERRAAHEPIAFILGRKEFYGREFAVAPGVLIPRMDSETTVAAALEACAQPPRVLDCGVGSGALLLTVLAERPEATGLGIDRSNEALAIAAANAEQLGLSERASFREADWDQPGWSDDLGRFD